MVCEICEVIELDILDYDDEEITLEVDFQGEYVSGSTGEEYQEGYNKGYGEGKTALAKTVNEVLTETVSGENVSGQLDTKRLNKLPNILASAKQAHKDTTDSMPTEPYLLDNVPSSIYESNSAGYGKGYTQGHEAGYTEGYTQGRTDEWSGLWDAIQDYGNRTDFSRAFRENGWNDTTFKPKYPMVVTDGMYMFERSSITDTRDIAMDFSKAVDLRWLFQYSSIVHAGVIDTTSVQYDWAKDMFFDCKQLQSIEKFIFANNNKTTNPYGNTVFRNCSSFTTITFEGVLKTTMSFVYSPLTVESAKSVISCLANYAGTENEFTYTISFSETTWGYLDAEGNASPNGTSWRDYIYLKGWIC